MTRRNSAPTRTPTSPQDQDESQTPLDDEPAEASPPAEMESIFGDRHHHRQIGYGCYLTIPTRDYD